MAYRSRRWQCPDCSAEFSFLHEIINGIEEPPPAHCPRCGNRMDTDAQPLPSKFTIASSRGRSPDQVFRQMEESSAARAAQAADLLGVPTSEMSHLKVTDLKDNLREGDTAAVVRPSPAPMRPVEISVEMQRAMAAAPGVGNAAQQQGMEYAAAAMSRGPEAGRHGADIMAKVREQHSQLVPIQRPIKGSRRAS